MTSAWRRLGGKSVDIDDLVKRAVVHARTFAAKDHSMSKEQVIRHTLQACRVWWAQRWTAQTREAVILAVGAAMDERATIVAIRTERRAVEHDLLLSMPILPRLAEHASRYLGSVLGCCPVVARSVCRPVGSIAALVHADVYRSDPPAVLGFVATHRWCLRVWRRDQARWRIVDPSMPVWGERDDRRLWRRSTWALPIDVARDGSWRLLTVPARRPEHGTGMTTVLATERDVLGLRLATGGPFVRDVVDAPWYARRTA